MISTNERTLRIKYSGLHVALGLIFMKRNMRTVAMILYAKCKLR